MINTTAYLYIPYMAMIINSVDFGNVLASFLLAHIDMAVQYALQACTDPYFISFTANIAFKYQGFALKYFIAAISLYTIDVTSFS